MPKLKKHIPKLCRHHSGHAFVKISGGTRWLGKYGSGEAQEAYDRLVGEWLANGRDLPPQEPPASTSLIVQLIRDYIRDVEAELSPGQFAKTKQALRHY